MIKKFLFSSVLCFLVVFLLTTTIAAAQDVVEDEEPQVVPSQPQCIAWSAFQTVMFTQGQTTRNRVRASNIPTMNCVGNCPSEARLDAAHCTQVGTTDEGTPTWRCSPNFAPNRQGFRLGTIRVECEGCTRRGDSSIRRGSCALYYSVVSPSSSRRHGNRHDFNHESESMDLVSFIVLLMFVMCSCAIAKKVLCGDHTTTTKGGDYVTGVPVGAASYHHHYGGGGSGGGFGTGMLTGLVVGDMLSRPYHNHGSSYYNNDTYASDSGWGGGGGGWGGDGGGFGGSDAI